MKNTKKKNPGNNPQQKDGDEGAAAAAPDGPKPDMTVARVDDRGRVIIPAGVVTLRDPSQLTLPIVARDHQRDLQVLVSDLQYLVHALQKAPKGQLRPVDLSRLSFNRAAFDVLLRSLNLDGPLQLQHEQRTEELKDLPLALRNVVAGDHGGHNVTLLLQFIATLMENKGPINLINTGAAIEAQNQTAQNQTAQKVAVLPLEVLNELRPLTLALQNEDPLRLDVAMQNACAALADFTDNAVVAFNYQSCTHLAEAMQANRMLPVALFGIPAPIIEALAVLQPGQQQEVFKFTPELIATLKQQFGITAIAPEEQITQLQALANLVRAYARSKPQQEQVAALLAGAGGADQQALAVFSSLAGANQENIEQRLWITATVLDALVTQLAHQQVPLSFFVTRNIQGQFDYGYASANSTPATIMTQEGVFHAIGQKMVTQLTNEQADFIDSIAKMASRRQALTQPTSTAQPQQPAPQPGQPGWATWLYNNLPTRQRVLNELLKALVHK